jgi:L-fucose isomerase-like protein
MQILKLLTGDPVLFADVRHYHADRDVWDLCNSGQHATWYAARSEDPAENLRLMRASTYEWPHAFARLDASAADFLGRFGSNHIHAVPGDLVPELREVCRHLGIRYDGFGSAA